MKRRELIKYTAWATGAALSTPLILSLSGCKSENIPNYTAQYFSKVELNEIGKIIDLILPKTDSPSATDVGVHQTIDNMVANVYKKEEQESYRRNFSALIEFIKSQPDMATVIKEIEKADRNDGAEHVIGYRDIKQQAIAYYMTSEEVITNHLNYLPVPGEFKPCIDVSEVQNKAWAI